MPRPPNLSYSNPLVNKPTPDIPPTADKPTPDVELEKPAAPIITPGDNYKLPPNTKLPTHDSFDKLHRLAPWLLGVAALMLVLRV